MAQPRKRKEISSGTELLANYIRRCNVMTEKEARELSAFFKEVRIARKQFLLRPGGRAMSRNFIAHGAVRAYVTGPKGEEHTILLGVENWWITDYDSYINQRPASMFVITIEDSVIMQLDFEKEQRLKQSNHKYETFFRKRAEAGHAFQYERLIANLTLSASERYYSFADKYPEIVQRSPQYALASYLGMSKEYLSRIRAKKTKGLK